MVRVVVRLSIRPSKSSSITDVLWLNGKSIVRGSTMVLSNRALATLLSIVTMFSSAAVLIKTFQALSGRISEKLRDRAMVTINH